ncbi:hypothetical protein NESM_000555000 [Novymonas esmeraldas]|uniref:Uncharacterized protein n=1 Tax=Novymonas esmeraldas TaxID=1808958 RepID=A0AAW0ESC6_9TRYP
MSTVPAHTRYHDRPPSRSTSRRRYSDEDSYPARSTPHRRHASSQQRPHRSSSTSSPRLGSSRPSWEPHHHNGGHDDHAPEEGVPPLRRQSTQPPRRRSSPTSYPYGDKEADGVYRRRAVEATSPARRTTPHRRHPSSRHATPAEAHTSTALVVVDDSARASPRRSARASTTIDSPRRSHNSHHHPDASAVGADGVVRSPRRRHSSVSPHRTHRPTSSPIRPERRTSSSHQNHRHTSAEPRGRSSHGSARRHRHADPAGSAAEATHRQDTLRYRSPPHAEVSARREATPHRSRRHSRTADTGSAEKAARSPRRHSSAHHSRSSRPDSRHNSERRHHHHRESTPASAEEPGRRSRHTPLPRPPSEDLYAVPQPHVAPRRPPPPPISEAMVSAPIKVGSTYVRPATNGVAAGRPRSGSYIEVISVHSTRPGSTNGWSQSRSSATHSPRRPHDEGTPVAVCSARGKQIMERIDSTRHWIENMKEEVKKDHERAVKEEEEEAVARERERERRTRHAAREARPDGASRVSSTRRHRTSSTGSHRHRRDEVHDATEAAAVASRRHAREPIPPAASHSESITRAAAPAVPPRREEPEHSRSRHNGHSNPASTVTHSVRSHGGEGGRQRAGKVEAPAPARAAASRTPTPDAAAPPAMMDTVASSRQGGFDYPMFSFTSFLDGNTFDTTADLYEYNVNVAEGLSDEHLELLRGTVFGHNEEAFAELLYGDDVQAEIDAVTATLGLSEDLAVQRESVALQQAAVRAFNDKCAKALKVLLAAEGGLAEAVQVAASQLERHALNENGSSMVAP